MHHLITSTEQTFQALIMLRPKKINILVAEDNEDVLPRILEIFKECFPLATITVVTSESYRDMETIVIGEEWHICFLDNNLSKWPWHHKFEQQGTNIAKFIKANGSALVGLISNHPPINKEAFEKGLVDFAIDKSDLMDLSEILS